MREPFQGALTPSAIGVQSVPPPVRQPGGPGLAQAAAAARRVRRSELALVQRYLEELRAPLRAGRGA
jgi:hypothetical protein